MQQIRLKFSLLDWVLYRGDRQILDVRFRTGKLYRYFGVPQARYQELLSRIRWPLLQCRNSQPLRLQRLIAIVGSCGFSQLP